MIAADLTEMQVNANIDEADVGRIRPGQHVTFRVDAYPTDNFIGTVTQIRLQPVVVQNVTTYGTVITVPNRELKLKPGMTANVKIEIAKRTNALRIPNAALRFRPTDEIFAALNQTPPPEAERVRRRRSRRTRRPWRAAAAAVRRRQSSAAPDSCRGAGARRRRDRSAAARRDAAGVAAAASDGGGRGRRPWRRSRRRRWRRPAAAAAAVRSSRRACSNASRPCRLRNSSSSSRA